MKVLVYRNAHTLENCAIPLLAVPEPVLRDSGVSVEVRAIGVNPVETLSAGSAAPLPERASFPAGRSRAS